MHVQPRAGALLVWVGWALVLGPASYLASYVPLLRGLVGCMHGSWVKEGATWGHSLGALGRMGLGLSHTGGPAGGTVARDAGRFCPSGSASWPSSSPARMRSR